ncbi:MAG: sigma-70 family RNA polymerase sigma factor [Planctomycetota bacterium]
MPSTPNSLEALLSESDWIRRVARALVRDDAAAEDLAQDVLDVALAQAPRLEGGRLRGWLATVARRRAIRTRARTDARHRAERVRARTESFEPGPLTDRALDRVVLHRELARVVAELGAAERTAIVEHYLEGRTYAEIAARSGDSVAAVRQRTSRALRRLRARLSEDDPRWAQWLPALALLPPRAALPSAAGPSTLQAYSFPSLLVHIGALVMTKLAVAAAAIGLVLMALIIWFSTNDFEEDASRSDLTGALARPVKARTEVTSPRDERPVLPARRTILEEPVAQLLGDPRLAIVGPSGAPIAGLRAACILDDRTVRALTFDEGGTAVRPNERCVIVATAPGFAGREFALQAPGPGNGLATRSLERASTFDVQLEWSESDAPSSARTLDLDRVRGDTRASASREAFPVMFADQATIDRVTPHVDLDFSVMVDRSGEGLRLRVPVETPSVQIRFPDWVAVSSLDGSRVSADSFARRFKLELPRDRAVIGLRPLPSIAVRALWEDDGAPFDGSVSIVRTRPGERGRLSGSIQPDERGEFVAATVVDGDVDAEAWWFRFIFYDRASGSPFEVEADRAQLEGMGSPATLLVRRPRIVHLQVGTEARGTFEPIRAEILHGSEGRATDERGLCPVPWPHEGHVFVWAEGHALRSVESPSERVHHSADSPLRVVVHPSPTLEVLLPQVDGIRLRVDTQDRAWLLSNSAHPSVEPYAPVLPWRPSTGSGRMVEVLTVGSSDNARSIVYEPGGGGRITESRLRTDRPLRLRAIDPFGGTLAETEVQLDRDRTVDLRDAVGATREIVVHVVDPEGAPVPLGRIEIARAVDERSSTERVGFHDGYVRLAAIAPGDYVVTARAGCRSAADGVAARISVVDTDAEITLTVAP